jgi:ABC-type transport system substrate-binding protein
MSSCSRWHDLRFTLLLLAFLPLLSGCSPEEGGDRELVYALQSDVTSLDPIRATDDPSRLVTTQVFETLVTFDKNLEPKPLLAESWERNEDATRWTFELRPGVYFHKDASFDNNDSTRVMRAQDVAYSINRLLDDTTSLGAWILSDLLVSGGAETRPGVQVLDSLTVAFNLRRSYASFPARLSLPFTAIVPREAVKSYGKEFSSHPVGTGPFRARDIALASDRVALARNENYWRSIDTNLDRVVFQTSQSLQSILGSFRSGEIEAFELEPATAGRVVSQGELTSQYSDAHLITRPLLKVHFVGFHLGEEMNQDRSFRRAVNYAINKKELTSTVLNGLAAPATGPLPPGITGSATEVSYPYNPDSARALLKRSNYDGSPITYMTNNSTGSVAVAEYLESQLGEYGINLQIEENSESVWIDRLVKGDFEWAKLYFSLDYPAPDNPLSQFLTSNAAPDGPNFIQYSNSTFDRLYDQALQEPNPDSAATLYSRMNEIIRRDAPWLFLYVPERTIVAGEGVDGIRINSLPFSLYLDEVKISQ